MRVFIVE